jgi:Phage tail tube protein
MPIPAATGYIGVAKEASRAAGIAPTGVAPTAFPPIMIGRDFHDVVDQLADTASRGSMIDGPFQMVQGNKYSEGVIPDGPFFGDTSPWWLGGILGDYQNLASRSVSDAVTNATTTVTSATAAFTQNDVGRFITASADFAAGTYIVSVTNATTIVLNQAALTTGAAKTIVVGIATVVSHIFSLKNTAGSPAGGQPTPLTLTDFYGLTGTHSRQYPGCQVTEVNIKFTADGLLTIGAKVTGYKGILVAQPTAAFTGVTPEPGWENFAQVGGAAYTKLVSGELNLKRATPGKNGAIFTADGTQDPYTVFVGGLAVSGKITCLAEDDTEYLNELNNSKQAVAFDWHHGAGAASVGARFQMSQVNFQNVVPVHGGDYMQWSADLVAEPNATDAGSSGGFSPIKVHCQNLLAAATYQ